MTTELVASIGFVIASIVGLLVVRRRVPLEQLMEHHEVAGVCFAVLGGLYGIILAFVLVSSWERYEAARAETVFEASAAADLYRHAAGLSEPAQSQLSENILSYLQSVVDDEFPAMANGHASDVTQRHYYAVWSSIIKMRPTDAWEVALYQNTLEKLDDFADGRRHRLLYIETGLPGVIWIFLIAFGVATVGFTYLFGMRRLLPQVIITVVLAATIAWTLALVHETQAPFAGGLRVSDRAFQVVLNHLRHGSVENELAER